MGKNRSGACISFPVIGSQQKDTRASALDLAQATLTRIASMVRWSILLISGSIPLLLTAAPAPVKKAASAPLPPIPQLVREVRDRQYQSD